MGRDRRQSPRLETLEGKQLLSGIHYDHVVARPAAVPVLNGTLKGDLSTYSDVTGPTETMSETFAGKVRAMGRVKAVVTDQMDAAGNLISGQITLTNARGSVVLGFGPGSTVSGEQDGNMSFQVVRYSVVSGTGAYAGATGAGTFTAIQNSGKSSTLVLETTAS